jgi:RNA-dependent RNA polymerase
MVIGRWTTYRFIFENNRTESGLYEMIKNAFQDFNIEVVDLEDFSIIPGRPVVVWSLLDHIKADTMKTDLSPLQYEDATLPFEVRYQLEVCISQDIINAHNISPEFVRRLAEMARRDTQEARKVLEIVAEAGKRIFDPMSIFEGHQIESHAPKAKLPNYCALSRKATITPTTIYFSSPTVDTTNRVIREYSAYGDQFLRVQFTDEKFEVISILTHAEG